MAVERAVERVARLGADARAVRLDLVRDVEAVDVDEPVLDAQVGVDELVEVDEHLEVARLDAVHGVRTRPERVQLVELLAAGGVRLVAERVLHRLHAARQVHLRQVQRHERVRLEARGVDDPAAHERHGERGREVGRRQRAGARVQKVPARRRVDAGR